MTSKFYDKVEPSGGPLMTYDTWSKTRPADPLHDSDKPSWSNWDSKQIAAGHLCHLPQYGLRLWHPFAFSDDRASQAMGRVSGCCERWIMFHTYLVFKFLLQKNPSIPSETIITISSWLNKVTVLSATPFAVLTNFISSS